MAQDLSPAPANRHEAPVRAFALAFPEAHEDFPWGERAIKVRGEAFVFMSNGGPDPSLSVKLPDSHEFALHFPCAQPTHYGLGRAAWVTLTFAAAEKPPLDMLQEWIEESYRAVAPKRLSATVPAGGPKAAKP